MRNPVHGVPTLLCTLLLAPVIASANGTSSADWYDLDWQQRVRLEAKSELVAGSFDDFTLLVKVDASTLAGVLAGAQADGADLVFTASDGTTVLDHEIVGFDPVASEAEIWFRAPLLSPTENVFYLYFDNPSAVATNDPRAAWSPNHLAVYHFDEDPTSGSQSDSSPSQNVCRTGEYSVWEASDRVPGQIGDGWNFDAIDNYLYTPNMSSADSSYTISAWFYNSPLVNKASIAMATAGPYWELSFQRSSLDHNAGVGLSNSEIYWQPDIVPGVMRHYVWMLDAEADTARFFLDGVEQEIRRRWVRPGTPNVTYTNESLNGRVSIASPLYGSTADLVDGIVDEFKIVEGARSPEWILTEYRNQSAPSDFYLAEFEDAPNSTPTGIGGTSLGAGGLGQVTVWPNPFRSVLDVTVPVDGVLPRVQVYDAAGRLVRDLDIVSRDGINLQLRWDGRDASGRSVGNGIYYVRAVNEEGVSSAKVLMVR